MSTDCLQFLISFSMSSLQHPLSFLLLQFFFFILMHLHWCFHGNFNEMNQAPFFFLLILSFSFAIFFLPYICSAISLFLIQHVYFPNFNLEVIETKGDLKAYYLWYWLGIWECAPPRGRKFDSP